MCQALRQRSIRAITKLTRYIHTFSMDGYFFYIFVHHIKNFLLSITNNFLFFFGYLQKIFFVSDKFKLYLAKYISLN